jgi:endonuclease/exonuclease/phosphatase family metal-dependent hydrolase
MDMRSGTWNVRSMCRASSLRAAAQEISEYNLDLMGVQEIDRTEVTLALNQQANIHFSMERGMKIMN